MDKIYIEELEFIGFHGVFQEEKKLGQKFIVSLEMEVDTREAGKSGDLTKSVHYGMVAKDIEKIFLEESMDLLEECAEKIARFILKNYELVRGVKVVVKKPWAPLQMHFKNVAVEIYRKKNTVYLSLGTNIGDRSLNLKKAIDEIKSIQDTEIKKVSEILETKPFGYLEQDDFLNCCVEIETLLLPLELLRELQNIENKMGRKREIKWGPRIIDIDILFYNKEIVELDELIIPHPWICEREFVLEPLKEIAPNYIHPLENKSVAFLLYLLKK